MTAARAEAGPLTFAGLPAARWLFGLRVWAAMMLALGAAFWMELDGASSAGICVAILAQPTRGQAIEKAFFRLVATAVGVAASIAIAGLFAQERTLFIVAVSAWLGLCVFACNMLDGNRAYAAVLSGYTVAIVAVMQIDKPQDVFSSGIDRGAAIAIGIAATALVNDLFASPSLLPKVLADLAAARRKSLDVVRAALRDGPAGHGPASDVFRAVLALHPVLSSLEAESAMGANRAAAARSTVAAIVEEVMAARALAGHGPAAIGAAAAEDLARSLGDAERARAARDRLDRAATSAATSAAASATGPAGLPLLEAAALAERDRRAAQGLADLRADRRPESAPRLPLFRSRRVAARKGARVGLAVALSAGFLVYSSWPQTSAAFALLAVVAGLAANSPSPTKFVTGALVAVPIAAALAGVLTFIVLDGVDAFPLLCIAMAPPVVGSCLILTSPNPKFGGIGFLMLVFTPVFMGLSNPQSYDPQSYLFTVVLMMTAVLLLAVWLTVLAPSTPAQQRRWFLGSAAADLRAAVLGSPDRAIRRDPAEAAHRAADRIAQIAALGAAGDPDHDGALADAFLLADLEGAVRRARHRLVALGREPDGGAAAGAGAAALRALDPAALRVAAVRCRSAEERHPPASDGLRRTGASLNLAADLVDQHRHAVCRLAPGLVA